MVSIQLAKPVLVRNLSLFIIVAIATTLLLVNLGRGELVGNDELIYSSVSQAITQSNDWITLEYNGQHFFHKPPLEIWLTSLVINIFGFSTFSARVVSASFGIGIVILVFLVGRRLYGLSAAIIASLTTALSPLFLNFARQGMMDTTLTFFGVLAVYSYIRKKDHFVWWYLIWISLGLAAMTKGAAVVPIFAAVLAIMLIHEGWKLLLLKRFWIGVGVFLLITLPWHVAMILMHPEFLSQYIGYHVIERSSSAIEGHVGGLNHYIDIIKQWVAPWSTLIFLGLVSILANLKKRELRLIIPLVFTGVIFVFYTFVQTKLDWYIYPLIPFSGLAIGWAFSRAMKSPVSFEFYGIWGAALLTALLARPKPTLFLGLVLIGSLWFRRAKTMPKYSMYGVFGFFVLHALTVIRSLSSVF